MPKKSDMEAYANCMEEVKKRINFIQNFLERKLSLGSNNFDYELICLNIRKILELIAFSSLCANKEKYSLIHEKYLHEWRTKNLVSEIKKINPSFYPKPLNPNFIRKDGKVKLDALEEGFLTEPDFEKLLNLCSDVLHAWNPYSPRERRIDFKQPISSWIEKIEKLLFLHLVQLADSESILLVQMSGNEGKVHVHLAPAVENIDRK